ncbi:hypothetical protein VOLCADRAFT_118724, partial [Volvox carteri f. nagariensis]
SPRKPRAVPKPRRSRGGPAGGESAVPPMDFSGTDPDTFRQYDTRPDPDEGGTSLERAAPGMISRRFSELLWATDPATLHSYGLHERMTGTELQLYERAYGEFMYLYGKKLPEGASKHINTAAKQRCRPLLNRCPMPLETPASQGGGGGAAASEPDDAAAGDAAADGRKQQRQPAKRRRTLTSGGGRGGADDDDGDAAAAGPAGAGGGGGGGGDDGGVMKRRSSVAEGAERMRDEVEEEQEEEDQEEEEEDEEGGKGTVAAVAAAARRRRSAAAAATKAGSPRKPRAVPKPRRSRVGAAGGESAVPPMDFSGTDPDTFRQYDTRLDPDEGGTSLERAAPGMILSRWLLLISSADPATLRTYQAGEHVRGTELKMYDQAYGEFMYLYGEKLQEGAARAAAVRAAAAARRQVIDSAVAAAADGADGIHSSESDHGGGEDGGDAAQGALHWRRRRRRRRHASGAAAAGGPDGGDDDGDGGGDGSSDFSLGTVAGEESGGSSESGSLGAEEEEEEEEEGGSGGDADDEDEDIVEDDGDSGNEGRRGRGGRGRGGGRGSRGRRSRRSRRGGGGGSSSSQARRPTPREEEDAVRVEVASAIAAASRSVFEALDPAMNLDDPSTLTKRGGYLVYKRYIELRRKYDPSELPSYTRGEHLRGADLRAFVQAYGEFMELFGRLLPPDGDKKVKSRTKTNIRRLVIQSYRNVSGQPEAAANVGTNRATQLQSVMWSGKRRQGVREAAGVQAVGGLVCRHAGTLFMGYGEGGVGEVAAAGAATETGTATGTVEEGAPGALPVQATAAAAEAAAEGMGQGPGAGGSSCRETWETTLALWGRRTKLRYRMDVTHGSVGSSSAAAERAATAPKTRPPSYAIRFSGYVKDDHREISLEKCPGSDVCNGPAVPTAIYETRSLSLSATCLAWSPAFCVAATAAAATAAATAATAAADTEVTAAADGTAAVQSDGVSRYCVLAVGNKLGEVTMWRLGLPYEYELRPQVGGGAAAAGSGSGGRVAAAAAAAGPGPKSPSAQPGKRGNGGGGGSGGGGDATCSSPSSPSPSPSPSPSSGPSSCSSFALQWMGALRIHGGGAHVLRLAWHVAPEGSGGAAAAGVEAAAAAPSQWRVPQPHTAGLRDSLLLLTGLSDGAVLLWSAAAATLTRASDFTLLAEVCPPDGLAPTALDCTWLLAAAAASSTSDPRVRGGGRRRRRGAAVAGTHAGDGDGEGEGSDGGGRAAREGNGDEERERGCGDADGGGGVSAASGEQQREEEEEEGVHSDAPRARRLLVAAAKPCGAVFVWRSGLWLPRTAATAAATTVAATAAADGPPMATAAAPSSPAAKKKKRKETETEAVAVAVVTAAAAAGGGGDAEEHRHRDKDGAADLTVACSRAGGAASCLQPGAHGTFHCSGVALAAGQPMIVTGGTDGTVKCWVVSELKLPLPPPPSPPRVALQLTEVTDGLHRLDPCSSALPALPAQVRTLPLARQAVHGVAASGNGLVFAVLRTTATRQLDMAKNVMIHGRVLGGTVHLLTPYSMAAAAAEPPQLPSPQLPSPRQLASGLLFQAAVASCLWDLHALALRAGLVAAAALPPVPEEAWDCVTLGGEVTEADDAAMLEQVQGAEDAGNADADGGGGGAGPGGGGGGDGASMDPGRARLAALVRLDTEERRRAKLAARLQQLTTTKLMLDAMERFIAPLEAPYNAAAAAAAMEGGGSLLIALNGQQAWAWCGLRCATALRRLALSYTASRADPPGAAPQDQLADVDVGVVAALQQAGGAAAAAVAAPAAVLACRDAAARNEGELLQAHIWAALSYGIGHFMRRLPPAAAATAPPPLYKLLMADWVTLHVRHPRLRESELLPLTPVALSAASSTASSSDMLQSAAVAEWCCSFETTTTTVTATTVTATNDANKDRKDDSSNMKQGAFGSATTMTDTTATAAAAATVAAAAPQRVVLTLPRCGATLMVCESPAVWNCVVCARRYLFPPTRRLHQLYTSPPVPYCLFCGVRLANGHAPVSKGLIFATAGASILSQAARASRRTQLVPAALSHALVFRSPAELVFGTLLMYYFRILEREAGPSKFAAFAAISTFLSSLLQWAVFVYVLGLQLLMSAGRASLLVGGTGLVAGLIYKFNLLGVKRLRFPSFVRRFFANTLGTLLSSDTAAPAAHPTATNAAAVGGTAPGARRGGGRTAAAAAAAATGGGGGGGGGGDGVPSAPHLPGPTREVVEQLVAMGFGEAESIRALQLTNNDLEQAVGLLLNS